MNEESIIVFANHKGGATKTTTAFYTAITAAAMGRRVLAVDMDPRASLTSLLCKHFHAKNTADEAHVGHLLGGATSPSKYPLDVLINLSGDLNACIDLWPSSLDLANVSAGLQQSMIDPSRGMFRSLYALSDQLTEVRNDYDLVVIDTPPDASILTINALIAAEYVVIPAIPEPLVKEGVDTTLAMIRQMRSDLRRAPVILGLVIGRVTDTLRHKAGVNELSSLYDKGENLTVLGVVPDRNGKTADKILMQEFVAVTKNILEKLEAIQNG